MTTIRSVLIHITPTATLISYLNRQAVTLTIPLEVFLKDNLPKFYESVL